jgi:hypothetical protein
MNLHKEAMVIAKEALEQSEGDFDDARDYIHQDCDLHEVAIYYHKAIQICADHDTSAGEEWLEDMGGMCQPGETFGAIACRIAYATLYFATMEALAKLESESDADW